LIRKLISLNINNTSDRYDQTMRMRHLRLTFNVNNCCIPDSVPFNSTLENRTCCFGTFQHVGDVCVAHCE